MPAPTAFVADYLQKYVEAYRREYERFVSSPPVGGGYPRIAVSPFLYSSELRCYLARDGVALSDQSWQPPYRWEIAGGPAMVSDYPDPDSRIPSELVDFLKQEGLWKQPIGLYRVTSTKGFSDEVWNGDLGAPSEVEHRSVDSTNIIIERYSLDWRSLIERLTYGVYSHILDIHLPDASSRFWNPHITRDLGFLPADRRHRRFFHYLELSPHMEEAAWDVRSIPTRVHVDLQRDFADAFARGDERGGSISFGERPFWPEHYHDRLAALEKAIQGFAALLETRSDEGAFQEYLERYPILIDVYGTIDPRPRLSYPEGQSPLGKVYVEPDFIVRYPGQSYMLVEIERPSKKVMTKQGQPRSDLTQAAFQITEWRTYIQKHYNRIAERYPGIAVRCRSMVVLDFPPRSGHGVKQPPSEGG